jgi:hypothetical protein
VAQVSWLKCHSCSSVTHTLALTHKHVPSRECRLQLYGPCCAVRVGRVCVGVCSRGVVLHVASVWVRSGNTLEWDSW